MTVSARLFVVALLPLAAVACSGSPTAPVAPEPVRATEVVPWFNASTSTTASADTIRAGAPRKTTEVVPWF
jgi:hypothetical protein